MGGGILTPTRKKYEDNSFFVLDLEPGLFCNKDLGYVQPLSKGFLFWTTDKARAKGNTSMGVGAMKD